LYPSVEKLGLISILCDYILGGVFFKFIYTVVCTDEGCNGHVRYCCNLGSVVFCKLSQLNLSETTGINGTKFFLEY
jgi:hypothetical protein